MELKDVLLNEMSSSQLLENVRARMMPVTDKLDEKLIYLKMNYPEWEKQTIQKADEAMEGMFKLPGTENELYFVGNPPDWHSNPVGNDEYVWFLNRHYHFESLALAYNITGDKKYANRAVTELLDWIEKCPMPEISTDDKTARERFYAATPWRTLEVSIRVSSWYKLLKNLINTEFITEEVLEKLVISVYEHGLSLQKVTPVFWPKADHNHYLHEMFGLLIVTVMFPELKTAKEWQKFAIFELERCIKTQFSEDGGQIEASPGYHDICLRMTYECLEVGKTAGIDFPLMFLKTAEKAALYSAFCIKPDGSRAALGDSDWELTSIPKILALHFGIYNNLGIFENIVGLLDKKQIDKSVFEYTLLFGNADSFMKSLNSAKADSKIKINYQRQINQVFYRSNWGKGALYYMLSCLSPVSSGHAHIDPMTFELNMNGQKIVIDPARYTYAENEMRRAFKSPQYHSTLTIGNRPPFEYVDTWSFTEQRNGYINKLYDSDIFGVEAIHYNYEPAVHKRLLFAASDKLLVVLDDVYNPNREEVRIYFHLNCLDATDDTDSSFINMLDDSVRIYYQNGLSANILEGFAAPKTDMLVPTKRVELIDNVICKENTKYLTVFSAEGPVENIKLQENNEYTVISFINNSNTYAFCYKFGEELKKL